MKKFLSILIVVVVLCTLVPALCSAKVEIYRCEKCGIKGVRNSTGTIHAKLGGPRTSERSREQLKCDHVFVPDGFVGM